MGIFNATSTYGKKFKPTGKPNEYSIKIFTGGFAGSDTAAKKLESEIEKFIASTDFKEYEIVNSKFQFFPSGYKYIVKFKA